MTKNAINRRAFLGSSCSSSDGGRLWRLLGRQRAGLSRAITQPGGG